MRNIFHVYIFPSKMNTSRDIRQKLERSQILGGPHPSRGKSTGQIVVTFSMFIRVLFLTTLWKKIYMHQLCPGGILICLDYMVCFKWYLDTTWTFRGEGTCYMFSWEWGASWPFDACMHCRSVVYFDDASFDHGMFSNM